MSAPLLHVFTIYSDETKIQYLKRSCPSSLSIQYVLVSHWKGYVDKITTMIHLLESVPDEDIVCFIDAYDVFAYSCAEEIIEKFLKYDCRILLSSELNCYPKENEDIYDALYTSGILSSPTNYKYVNSGGYIGYCADIRRMFSWKSVAEIEHICVLGGDQNYFTQFYLDSICQHHMMPEQPWSCIKLDIYQRIFQSMYKVDLREFYFHHGRLYNKILSETPCFAHLNGYKVYNDMIVCMDTGKERNVMEVFWEGAQKESPWRLHYRVPFFIFYGGIVHGNISQCPSPIDEVAGGIAKGDESVFIDASHLRT